MTPRMVVKGLLEEAQRYEAAAIQQDKMAEWTNLAEPAKRSRKRALLFREAARIIESMNV